MSIFPSALSYKYARALLSVANDITPEQIKRIETTLPILRKHRQTLLYITLLHHKYEAKHGSLDVFIDRFDVIGSVKKLIHLLLEDKRLVMLPDILQATIDLYKQDHHITSCTITSTDELPTQQKKDLETLIKKIVHGTVEAQYQTDPHLIAGMRVQTDNLLFEHSVEKQLRQAHLLLVRNYRGY